MKDPFWANGIMKVVNSKYVPCRFCWAQLLVRAKAFLWVGMVSVLFLESLPAWAYVEEPGQGSGYDTLEPQLEEDPTLGPPVPEARRPSPKPLMLDVRKELRKKPISIHREPVPRPKVDPQMASAATKQTLPPPRSAGDSLVRMITTYNKTLSSEQARYLAYYILSYSQAYGVDYRIVASVIAVESSFRHDAISSAGAEGLGQLKPETAQWLGVYNSFDPVQNIGGCTRYLRYLFNKYQGNWDEALSAYFQGPGTIDKAGGVTDMSRPYLYRVRDVLMRFQLAAY